MQAPRVDPDLDRRVQRQGAPGSGAAPRAGCGGPRPPTRAARAQRRRRRRRPRGSPRSGPAPPGSRRGQEVRSRAPRSRARRRAVARASPSRAACRCSGRIPSPTVRPAYARSPGARRSDTAGTSSSWSPTRAASPSPLGIEASPATRFIGGLPMKLATNRFAGRSNTNCGSPVCWSDAAAHDGDPVAHRHRLDLVVRDVDRRHAELALHARDLGAHLHAQTCVEVGERLVHEEDARVADDRAAHRDALALAARELARLALEQVCEPERLAGRSRRAAGSRPSARVARAARTRCSRTPSCAGRARSSGRPSRRRGCAGRGRSTQRSPM